MSEVKKTMLQELREAIGLSKTDIKMGSLKLKDGKTKIQFEGDAPELGKPVFLVLEDKSTAPIPKGKHELENGEVLNIDENGLVAEAVNEEEVKEPSEEMVAELTELLKEYDAKFSKQVNDLKESFELKLKEKEEENKALEAKLEKEPAAEKIVKTELAVKEPKTKKERLLNAISLASQN